MVYLLHFNQPYRHAQHYIGYCEEEHLKERFERHLKGNGAKLIQVVTQAGITLEIARTWPGADRTFERQLKNRKKSKDLCPICRANKRRNNNVGNHD